METDTDQVIAELTNCIENASRWNVSGRVSAPNEIIIWLPDGTRYKLIVKKQMPGRVTV